MGYVHAFRSKSVDSGPRKFRILHKQFRTHLEIQFTTVLAKFYGVWDDSRHQNPSSSNPWAIAQATKADFKDFGGEVLGTCAVQIR